MYRGTYESDNVRLANPLANLARVHMERDGLAEAEPLLRDALAITQGALGEDHPNAAAILRSLAVVLRSTGRPAAADSAEARAEAIEGGRGA